MKYRRILAIMLVSVLLCTSISAMTMAAPSEKNEPNTLRERIANMFYKIFSAIPSLNAFLLRRAPEPGIPDAYYPGTPEVPPTPEAETPEQPQPPQEPIDLAFEIELRCEEEDLIFKLGELIEVSAKITNNCKETTVILDEMDVQLGNLDYYIRTPEGYVIHYIGIYRDSVPSIVRIKPGETYESRAIVLNDPHDDVTFGIIPYFESSLAVEPSLYEEFGEGLYFIHGEYTSNCELEPSSLTAVTDQVFNGRLHTEEIRFAIVYK